MIDREKHCPFLLRVFFSRGAHNRQGDRRSLRHIGADAFEALDDKPIANELHIYTWPDATLREIADLVQDSNSDAQKPNMRLSICVVSETRDGRVLMRKVGYVNSSRRRCVDDTKTLASVRFHPGDMVDIAMVDTDTFLAKVSELYAEAQGSKGSVAVSCKMPVAKVNGKAQQKILKLTVEDGEHVLLFRVCKYGNNKHKKKYSAVVTAVNHASFHASLSQIVKTKVDAPTKDAVGKGPKRVVAKVKKTTE
ncbi:Sin3 associated polypeptide p18 [Phytophthora cactorum]|nr:Sin3 associated polypeptide p18 [Phytophthora cactorum]